MRGIAALSLLIVAVFAGIGPWTWIPKVFGPSGGHTYPIVNTNSTKAASCTTTYGGESSTGMNVNITPQNRTTVIVMVDPIAGANATSAGITFILWRAANAVAPACGAIYTPGSFPGTDIAEWTLSAYVTVSYTVEQSSPFTFRDSGLTKGTTYTYFLAWGISWSSNTGATKLILGGGDPQLVFSNMVVLEE